MKQSLIAPCGMNCNICYAHLREENQCTGCRGNAESIFKYCKKCIIRSCEHFADSKNRYCFSCAQYPCKRLKQLDKRYRSKYRMSMLENLTAIKENGVRNFVKIEEQNWKCRCGATLSCHRSECAVCGEDFSDTP